MRQDTTSFAAAYATALCEYVSRPGEAELAVAYELGRQAVSQQLSVLDVAVAHQEALLSALERAPELTEARQLTRAAGDFFLESLSSYEMVARGLDEARRAYVRQRRQTELSRQLSSFLADASLALDASQSVEEMLRLVVEQARELVDAECCLATVAVGDNARAAQAISHLESGTRWRATSRWLDLSAAYRMIAEAGGSVRMAGEPLARLSMLRVVPGNIPPRGWLAASLIALDGSQLGALQAFDKQAGEFTADDEAALVHLAQMAAAAVERTRLYAS